MSDQPRDPWGKDNPYRSLYVAALITIIDRYEVGSLHETWEPPFLNAIDFYRLPPDERDRQHARELMKHRVTEMRLEDQGRGGEGT